MRKMSVSVCIVLYLASISCSVSSEYLIEGSAYKYDIPKRFVSNTGSYLYSRSFNADKARVLELMISSKESKRLSKIGEFEVSILAFLDREYDYDSVLKSNFEIIESDSQRTECEFWQACYHRQLAGQHTDYYFTFEPTESRILSTEKEDYIFTVKPRRSSRIAGQEVGGKVVCSSYLVIDGILIQVDSSGIICKKEHMLALPEEIHRFFFQWRQQLD